ncbi:hypothetical protein HYALB_00001965 [Hymenoscyphus albidus]|uniref:Uncharacterized protein n=1 Tax=Hymenoscyphus albidus TaxID=595503 RepID=A0A9N9LAW4_9HELO|nr:hypothetical protein HYALB_00001965 [Hymenoscyphus albidus]
MEHDASKKNIFMGVLLKLAFLMDASDPRDRICAFLAFQEPNENQIVPDYGLEVNDAYMIISESIVKSTNSLSILGLVRGTSSPGSLPSWVVDWRVKEMTQGNPFDENLLSSRRKFDACSGYQHRTVDKMTITKSLPVRGKRLSEIVAVSSVIHHGHLPLNRRFKIDEVLNSIDLNLTPEKRFSLERDQDDLYKRILLVLTAQDMNVFKSPFDREYSINRMLRAYQNDDRAFNVPEKYLDIAKQLNDIGGMHIIYQKRVFYSGVGLFGLGPELMKENDLICILHGSIVPIIPREQKAGFELVGQCYFENWMHGDLVYWKEDEGDLFNLI